MHTVSAPCEEIRGNTSQPDGNPAAMTAAEGGSTNPLEQEHRMAIIDQSTADIDALRARMDGRVATPADADWDSARQAWNVAIDQKPAAVAFPTSETDVVAIVEYARAAGLRVNVQGTGHNPGPLTDMSETLLVRTSEWREVRIDPMGRRVRVRPGTLWDEVVSQAAVLGLAPIAGSSPDVGVVGYTLGGGMGYLSRRYGLASNSVTAVELVNADGEVVRADADTNPDLFWAIRGGGGNFGIVTSLEFRLYPVEKVYGGALMFPFERSREVLHAWREWTETMPDTVTSMARLVKFPPFDEVPEPVRGRAMVVITAAMLTDEDGGSALLRPLRELGPEIDTFAAMPPAALSRLHMDPEGPTPGISDHTLLEALTPETVDAVVDAAGPGVDTPLIVVELRHLGGALGRVAPGAGALPKVDGAYMAFAVGIPMDAESGRAVARAARETMDALAPWSAGRTYLNFAERPTNTRSAYSVEAYERLQEVRRTVDPAGLFRANHEICG
jgi:FAD/FMN-containing dehydrogenase